MNYSLCMQSTYQHVNIALCNGQQIIESTSVPNHASSATLVPHIDALLKRHAFSLANCSYITVNQGPGPFTTLRTILATVQGIADATNIPLIGIDGLKGLIESHRSAEHLYTIALLNAFNNEYYYAIASDKECFTGYGTPAIIQNLIQEIVGDSTALVIGNGIPLIKKNPDFVINSNFITFDATKEHCSIDDIATLGYAAWNNNQATHNPLMPLYLKKHAVERTKGN